MNKLFKFNLIVIICLCFCFFIGCNKEVKFDVKFIVEGEIFETIGTSGNEVIAIPADPIKDGYIFDGWYWDKDVWVKPFTANSLLNIELRENINVYARFLDEDDPVGVELKFEGFDLIESQDTGDVFYGEVANSQVNFAFSNYVEVSNKATWTVSKDVSGNDIVNSKTVVLDLGNNLFFIQVTDETGKVKQYNIVVRRHLMYNVYFNTNGGSYVNSIVVEEDSFIDKPITSRTGYTFMGWDFDFNEPITSNLTINAMWEAKQYKVSLDANGGSCSNSLVYISYDEYYSLPTPVKAGYTFNGWYYENKKVNDGIWKTDEDISLVAKWTANTYTISYDLGGGTLNSNKPSSYETGQTVNIGNPSKFGYEFIGWSVNGSSEEYKDYKIYNTYGDITLVANYKANTYSVTLDSNGGDCETDLLTVIYNERYTLPTPTKMGYKFEGWYNGSTKVGSGVWYRTYSLDLKAKWIIANYSITYDLKGGKNNENNPDAYTFENDDITLLDASKTGYTFIGWTSNNIAVPTKNLLIEKGSTGELKFIANYTPNEYQITLDVNGGDELNDNKVKVVYDSEFSLPIPKKTGYEFKGWYNGTTKVNEGIWKYLNDLELTAQWKIIEYNISYELNGGVNHDDNPTNYNYETDEIKLNHPTKLGYEFIGWTSTEDDIPILDLTIPTNSVNDKSYIANWKEKTYTITYNVNGGNTLTHSKQSVVYDSSYTLITPTRPGYTFAGWYLNDNLVENGIWKVDHNSTLIAKWDIINYSITYDLNGAINHVNNPTSFSFETNDIILLDPSKKGYTFIGWTTNEITIPTKNVVIEKGTTTNVTFIANFIANIYNVTFDVNSGNELLFNELEVIYDNYYELPKPEKIGYEFMGWYNGNELVSDGLWKIDSDVNLVAKWDIINYNITYDLNGGRHSSYNPAKYNYEYQDIIINNPTKTGYTFIGWSVNSSEELVLDYVIKQYTNGDLLFTAKWKVNEYKLTLDVNGGNELDKCEFNINYDSIYTLPDVIRIGYTFNGWYNGKNKVESGTWKFSEDITLTAKWDVIYFNINYELDGGENKKNPLTYTYDDETIVLKDAYKKGHTFIGWVTDSIFAPTKALEIPHNSLGDFSFEAVFEANIYYITFDLKGEEYVEINEMEVVYGDYVELPIPSNGNYPFAGWYYEGLKVGNCDWYIDSNVTLTAKWKGIPYKESGKTYINLGRYPQTVVTDSNIISNLNNISKTNGLGYIEYDGEEYKKVTVDNYKSGYTFINGDTIINGSTYYFKVEPIKWRVLQETDGTYKLLSEYILDNMYYYEDTGSRTVDGSTVYENNYMYSNVRAWLNGLDGSNYNVSNYTGKGFLDIAFTNEEKLFINTTLVDNSASTTNNSFNSYTCSNTNDKVYLLSFKDMLNTSYGFSSSDSNFNTARSATVSDYARSKGCCMYTTSGKGEWWLRSPDYSDSRDASGVSYGGAVCVYDYNTYLGYSSNFWVRVSSNGVRPALEIIKKSK